MPFDLSQVQQLYSWIKSNFVMFVMITMMLLVGFSAFEFISGFMAPYASGIATQHADFKRAVKSYTQLDAILQHLLDEFHASRVVLFRFHDDERDISNMSFFFASAANIVASPGVTVDFSDLVNVPAASFAPILPHLMAHEQASMKSSDIVAGPMRELQIRRGTVYAAFVPVSDIEGNLVGFLEMDWLNLSDAPKDGDQLKMTPILVDDAARIASFFSLAPLSPMAHQR